VLTFEGKRYDLNGLPEEIKELVRGMQVADAQLRFHEDTLKVLAVGRQSMAMQLNERLKTVMTGDLPWLGGDRRLSGAAM
jgi:hypothetical protein